MAASIQKREPHNTDEEESLWETGLMIICAIEKAGFDSPLNIAIFRLVFGYTYIERNTKREQFLKEIVHFNIREKLIINKLINSHLIEQQPS